MVRLHALAIALVLIVCGVGTASAQRVALVIGNSAYEHAQNLPNPKNDAEDISAALARLGFDVTTAIDLGYAETVRTLGKFSQKAIDAEMAAVFYAGHGIEVNKQNYLIPTDAVLQTDVAISYEAIRLDIVMDAVAGAKGLKLVMLDACRDNPFKSSIKVTNPTRSIGRGLARVDPASATLVSFAAKEGTVAIDGEGDNSPYTRALLAHLEEPGLEVQFLFRKVRDSVLANTQNRQEPFTYASLPGEEIFLKDSSAPSAQPRDRIVSQRKWDRCISSLSGEAGQKCREVIAGGGSFDNEQKSLAYFLLAFYKNTGNDWNAAISYINMATELNPDFSEYACERAMTNKIIGLSEVAKKYFKICSIDFYYLNRKSARANLITKYVDRFGL